MKTYKGRYTVKNPNKYCGDASDVIYRSGWERSVMLWCDKNDQIVEWSSEEIIVPYRYDLDNSVRRYFVDFYIKFKDGKTLLVEVKPNKQTKPPEGKRRTKKYLNEAATYVMNQNKWESAKQFANNKGWEFTIWTEVELKKMGILPKTPKPMKKMPAYRRKKK